MSNSSRETAASRKLIAVEELPGGVVWVLGSLMRSSSSIPAVRIEPWKSAGCLVRRQRRLHVQRTCNLRYLRAIFVARNASFVQPSWQGTRALRVTTAESQRFCRLSGRDETELVTSRRNRNKKCTVGCGMRILTH